MEKYTDIEKANINFYGNAVSYSMRIDEVKSFLNEIHNFIEKTNKHLKKIKTKKIDPDALEDLKYHFEYTHGDILRKSIIISIIIILSSELNNYCNDFKKHKKLKINYKDFKGDLLERFKNYCLKVLDINLDFESDIWKDIASIYEIRNCLIHNDGCLNNFIKRNLIEDFAKRHNSPEIILDDYLDITNQVCLESISTVEKFLDILTFIAFEHFPGNYGGK